MTEIEMYVETIKAVNNEYRRVLLDLEDKLHQGYVSGEIPLHGIELKDTIVIMHAMFMTARAELKMHCDTLLEQIEREMEK